MKEIIMCKVNFYRYAYVHGGIWFVGGPNREPPATWRQLGAAHDTLVLRVGTLVVGVVLVRNGVILQDVRKQKA